MKHKVGILMSSSMMMSFLVPTSVLASIANSFPGASEATIQMITSIPSLIGIIVALFVSRLTTKIYKKTIIIFCTFCYLIGGPLPFYFHNALIWVLFGAGLLGVGMGGMITCVAALICDCFEGKERSSLMGLQAAFISGGGCFFSFLGGQLGRQHWEYSFLAYYIILIILIIEMVCLPKGKLVLKDKSIEGGHNEIRFKNNITKLLSSIPSNVIYLSAVGFIYYVFITIYNSNISMLVTYRNFGSTVEASYASISYTFAGMLAGFLVGRLMVIMNKKIISLSFLIAFLGLILCVFSTNLIMLCLGGFLCGTSFTLFTPAGNYYAVEKSTVNQQAFHISLFISISNLGQAVSPILVSGLSSLVGSGLTMKFVYAAIVCILLSIITKRTFAKS